MLCGWGLLLTSNSILHRHFIYLSSSRRLCNISGRPLVSVVSPRLRTISHTAHRWQASAMPDALELKHPSPTPSKALAKFLRVKKANFLNAVQDGRGMEWTVVMGNEAGDLDSVASAIAYAWFTSCVQKIPAVPLTQTPRTDIHLRPENIHAFSLAGLDPIELLCIDDVSYEKPGPFPANQFALVDHNRLNRQLELDNTAARVVAIIDHHQDEGLYEDTADPRIVTLGVGSCSSLVACLLEEQCPDKVPAELATLLLSAIVIDTTGMRPNGKAVDIDRRAAAFLAARSTLSTSPDPTISFTSDSVPALHDSPAICSLSDTLSDKKNSLDHLGTRDLLRRDYKEYAHTLHWAPGLEILVGLASVVMSLKTWLSRTGAPSFAKEVTEWMNERGLAVLGILTSYHNEDKPGSSGRGKHRREQMYVVHVPAGGDGETEELAERLFEGLEERDDLELKKLKWEELGVEKGAGLAKGWRVRAWKQKKTHATRKVTAPIVRAILEGKKVE